VREIPTIIPHSILKKFHNKKRENEIGEKDGVVQVVGVR